MRYNVFTDFHHSSLLNSFILLFEKRLGGNVYRPIGMEWADRGYWKVYDHPATQMQFLGIGGATPDGTAKLNEVVATVERDVDTAPIIYHCQDIDSGFTNKAITYEGFMGLPFNIVIATLPQHIKPFERLCEIHPSKPKFIYQIGNAWNIPDNSVRNVMASAVVPSVPEGVNFIQYHQEFDTSIFSPLNGQGYRTNTVSSFVNVFQDFPDWKLFQEVEGLMTDWEFKSYGGQCRDGAAHGSRELAEKMKDSQFIWHTKQGGDGFGHVIFNACATARPLIVKKEYYKGKLAEKMLRDRETCIAIDGLNPHEIVYKIDEYASPAAHATLSQNMYNLFREEVDFDREEQSLRAFLDRLI